MRYTVTTGGNTRPADSPSAMCEQEARTWYDTRLRATAETTRQLTARYRLLINVELGLALLLAIAFYLSYTHRLIDRFAGTVVFAAGGLLLLSVPTAYLLRTIRQLQAERKVAEYYEARKRRLNGTWPGTGDDGAEFLRAHHAYCADLDVLGPGSLFEYLSSARTGAGRDWLANALLSPAAVDEISERQEAIDELRGRHDLREYFAEAGSSSVNKFEGNSLRNWCMGAPIRFSPLIRVTGALLCIANLVVIALALSGRVSPEAPLVTFGAIGLFTLANHRK